MSVIRQKKKNFIKGILFGTVIMGILCAIIVTLFLYYSNIQKEKNKEQEIEWIIMYQLNQDKTYNEMITEEDLIELSIPKTNVGLVSVRKKDIVGKKLKISLSKYNFLQKELVYADEQVRNDIRLHNYNFIQLNSKLKKGDYIDVRICFPNGLDFIVLQKKEIKDCSLYNMETGTENELWLEVGEEEILRLSSAVVDAAKQEGCIIYAILYLEGTQEVAISTYPVSEQINQLIQQDPNIVTDGMKVLESNLREKLEKGDALEKEYKGLEEEEEQEDKLETNFTIEEEPEMFPQ